MDIIQTFEEKPYYFSDFYKKEMTFKLFPFGNDETKRTLFLHFSGYEEMGDDVCFNVAIWGGKEPQGRFRVKMKYVKVKMIDVLNDIVFKCLHGIVSGNTAASFEENGKEIVFN